MCVASDVAASPHQGICPSPSFHMSPCLSGAELRITKGKGLVRSTENTVRSVRALLQILSGAHPKWCPEQCTDSGQRFQCSGQLSGVYGAGHGLRTTFLMLRTTAPECPERPADSGQRFLCSGQLLRSVQSGPWTLDNVFDAPDSCSRLSGAARGLRTTFLMLRTTAPECPERPVDSGQRF